ncbi:MAG: hypothetical protein R2748_33275 [Bryobacterales bacterium]
MDGYGFTMRDLEEVRRRNRNRNRRRHRSVEDLRDCLITFAILAAAWLAREILL